jgi:hypothetical protein
MKLLAPDKPTTQIPTPYGQQSILYASTVDASLVGAYDKVLIVIEHDWYDRKGIQGFESGPYPRQRFRDGTKDTPRRSGLLWNPAKPTS